MILAHCVVCSSLSLYLTQKIPFLSHLHSYLLTYDPLQFHAYLETLIAANSTSASGGVKQHHPPWLLTDAANVIFQVAKRRCYTVTSTSRQTLAPVIDLVNDDDVWEALDEAENAGLDKSKGEAKERRPIWMPEGMEPILEELPKWNLLSEIIQEAEEEIIRQESLRQPITTGEFFLRGFAGHDHDVFLQ
jgi:DNA excision repair protein ERCC-4